MDRSSRAGMAGSAGTFERGATLLRCRSPRLHAWCRRRLKRWLDAEDPLVPALRRVRGEFTWVHPRFVTARLVDSEPHISGWIAEGLPEAGVFLDVGANVGWLSIMAARKVGRRGRVVAFEPSPILASVLRYHQRKNRLPQLAVVGAAISESDGPAARLYLLNEGFSTRNSLTIGRSGLPYLDSNEISSVDVPTLALGSFCESEGLRPDVIKIDVEGAEAMVLRGAAAVLRACHPTVIVSVHPFWLPPADSTEGILAYLAAFGYRVRESHTLQHEGFTVGDYLLTT